VQSADAAALTDGLVAASARELHAELIETHISWVLLPGDAAWKIKKPVVLPFVDYGTLERRQLFCEEQYYRPDGKVSGASPVLHTAPLSRGSRALVSSMWISASNCLAKWVKK
jgi:hypothetical protein